MRPASALALLLAAGCGAELLHDLDESQANEVVTVLIERGVDADKTRDDRPGRYRVVVPRADQVRAARLLQERELPRRPGRGVGEAFAEAGLVPSRQAEHARLAAALAVDAERALEAIPGVSAARVLLSLPAPVPARSDGERPRATAAVLLRVRGLPAVSEGEVRRLVAGGIEGLQAADVSLLVTVEPAVPAVALAASRLRVGPVWLPARTVAWSAVALAAAVVTLAAGLVFLRRK